MKKLIGFVCLLVLVAACQPVANENKSMNTNTATEKSTAPPSEAEMITKEKAAWDAFRRKDADAFKKMMAPEYMEVLNTGTMNTEQSLSGMKDFAITDVTFADWKMMTVDKDAVILHYTAKVKGTYQGKPIPEGPYHEASAYVNRNGEWLAIYYQETRSQTMPPPPPAKEEKTAPGASPMAKPPEAGPDVAANEKLVWDAIKSKNYDGFASYLASDSLEIEADGVYDKAGSIKGVKMFDASKAELSDWKTIKFDDDASLVIYKVTIPGTKPDISYHTTIWVKRDNKWQALFHMGTPAEEPGAAPATASPAKKM